jgi:hypothetical protein
LFVKLVVTTNVEMQNTDHKGAFFTGELLPDSFVTLGETNTTSPVECGQFQGPGMTAEMVHVVCPANTRGRFVKIKTRGSGDIYAMNLGNIRVLIS